MRKTILNMLLLLVAILCMSAGAAAYEGEEPYDFGDPYDVWVNGEQFFTNKTRIECGSGKAVYDELNNTIYLYGAEITETYTAPDGNRYAIYGGEGDEYSCLKVDFTGTTMNTVSLSGTDGKSVGIYSVGDLQFCGNPSSGLRIQSNGQLSGIKIAGTVYFASMHVEIKGFQYGIMANAVSVGEPVLKIQATKYVIKTTPNEANLVHFTDNPLLTVNIGTAYDGSDANPTTVISKSVIVQVKYLSVMSEHRYELYLGEKAFTTMELTRQCGNGTATFDPDTNTLTLENATITEGNHYDSNTVYSAIYSRIPFTIVLKGTNRIQHSVNTTYYIEGIDAQEGLTIKGPGSLEVDVPASMFDGNGGMTMGISASGNLSIENADIKVTVSGKTSRAIYASDNLTISNSTVYSKGNKAIYYREADTSAGEKTNAHLKLSLSSDYKVYVNEKTDEVWDSKTHLSKYGFVLIAKPCTETTTVTGLTNSWYGVTVKWKKVPGYDYKLYRKAQGDSSWTYIDQTSGTGYYDKTAKNNTRYSYAVKLCRYNKLNGPTGTAMSGIYMAPPTIQSVTNISGGAKVTWSAVNGANGYFVYRKDTQAGTWHMIGSTQKNLYYNDTTVENGVVYYYAIKSFRKDGTETVTSASSSAKNTIYVKNNFVSKLSNPSAGALKVEFSKTPVCTGYEIMYGTNSSLTGAATVRIASSTATDKTVTGLTKGKTYYVKVRAYKTVAGYTFYGNWSAVKNLTLTK